jgi:excisionase family DNA binding protein
MADTSIKKGVFSETITVEETAHILNISRRYAFELAKRNELPGVRRLGGGDGKRGKYMVSKILLEQWLEGKNVLPVDPVL